MKKSDKWFPYLLIGPSSLVIVFVLLLPLGYSIYCSMYKVNYMKFTEFVGFDNFIKVLSNPSYMAALGRTFYISAISLVFSLVLGIAFALWIHKLKRGLAYSVQLIVLIPWVTSQVVGALLWKWIFNEDLGLLNYFIALFGGGKLPLLSDAFLANVMLIFVSTWRTIGYAMVNVLSGLKGISLSTEEAARIDGTNSWQMLRYIRIPMLKTPLLLSTIILTLSNINNLVVPLTLTGGGPGTSTSVITIPIYRLAFESYQFGTSSALSIILFVITVILSAIYVKAVRYEV